MSKIKNLTTDKPDGILEKPEITMGRVNFRDQEFDADTDYRTQVINQLRRLRCYNPWELIGDDHIGIRTYTDDPAAFARCGLLQEQVLINKASFIITDRGLLLRLTEEETWFNVLIALVTVDTIQVY